MADSVGTLQIFVMQFDRLLKPLKDEMSTPARTRSFFASLGVVLNDGQASSIAAVAGPTITAIEDLTLQVGEIIIHVEAEAYAELTEDTIRAIQDIAAIINGSVTIGNAVNAVHSSLSAAEVAKRIINFLIFKYIETVGGVNEGLELFGLLDREEFNVDSIDPANPEYELVTYRFDRIGDWFSNPSQTAKDLYDWGENNFDGAKMFSRIERIASRLGLPVIYDDSAPEKRLDFVVVEAVPKTDANPNGLLIRIKGEISPGTIQIPMGRNMRSELDITLATPANTGLYFLPDGTVGFQPPSSTAGFSGRIQFKYFLKKENPPEPFIVFGEAGSSRFELLELIATTATEVTWTGSEARGEFSFGVEANGLKIIIDGTKGDGFLTKILPGTKIEAEFALLMGISTERGFYFSGSSALEIRLPAHIEIGPIAIEGLTIAMKLQEGKIPVSLGADIKASLGPLVAVVQNIGIIATFSFPPNNSGNLGPLQLDIGFKPPNGVGLSIDAGPVKGGGFLYLDFDKGEYFGALELTFTGTISLKAIGIINTKMPDGSKGFALLILITSEFTPIQLGFGFTLNGVGGLLGVNRSTDLDALRAGVKTGAVSSILFPQDVVANITCIISDLKSIFPITQDHFIIAPMAKIAWGTPTLISLELGIIIDIPAPRLVILGVLRCILPTEEAAILKLQVNFAGGIDFDEGLIWFDASLFDSQLLIFTLTGDMALRIGWKNPQFVISIGGFHPAFHEIPPDLTGMRRLGLSLLSGDNPRLGAMIYFAITSNSVQSGAKVELYAEACGFNIYGYLGYDLLVQFSPFYFIAEIYAGLALRSGTSEIMGIHVRCALSGPTPWNAQGSASISILFFEISIGFDVTWGDEGPAQPEELENVLELVKTALNDQRNWKADLPANANNSVTLRKIELAEGEIVMHPFSILSVSQKVVPLGLEINKFGNKKPSADTLFNLTYSGSGEDVKEEFAMANFIRMKDDEKLARKSFEKVKSGLRLGPSEQAAHGFEIDKDVTYELSYVHKKKKLVIKGGIFSLYGGAYTTLLGGNATSKNAFAVNKKFGYNSPAKVDTPEQQFMVVNNSNLELHAPHLVATSEAEAYMMHDALIRSNPSLKNNIQVVSNFELN